MGERLDTRLEDTQEWMVPGLTAAAGCPGADLPPKSTEKLLEAAKAVMEKSIELGGSTMRNYVKADGTRGNYLDLFAKVYGRDGEKCLECGAEIQKIKVGGRGTHFCPQCQRRKND